MLTIGDLVAEHTFGLTYLAGHAGNTRPVSWVHIVDLLDPWNWIDSGTLVLTTGQGFPTAEEQLGWIRQLIEHGACGVVIAAPPGSPGRFSHEALQTADEARFPVLRADYELRFTALAQHVTTHAVQLAGEHLDTSRRVLDQYATITKQSRDLATRLTLLATLTGIDIEVQDREGRGLVRAASATPSAASSADLAHPDSVRPDSASRVVTREAFTFVLTPHSDAPANVHVQRSIETVLDLEIQMLTERMTEVRHRNAALVDGLMSDRFTLADVERLLSLPRSTWVAVAVHDPSLDPATDPALQYRANKCDMVLATRDDNTLFGVMPEHSIEHIEEHFPTTMTMPTTTAMTVGVSEPISQINPLHAAIRQASLALTSTRASAHAGAHTGAHAGALEGELPLHGVTRFSAEQSRASMTVLGDDPDTFMETLLGPIRDRDHATGSELLRTLIVYLRHDGASLNTAQALGIHRHTLHYRLRIIEETTGLTPATTEGTAKFWLAINHAERTHWHGMRHLLK